MELPERPALNCVGASGWASPGELIRVEPQDPVTITRPSAVGNAGAEVLVKEVAGHEVTIAAPAGQLVDGRAVVLISGPSCKARTVSTQYPKFGKPAAAFAALCTERWPA